MKINASTGLGVENLSTLKGQISNNGIKLTKEMKEEIAKAEYEAKARDTRLRVRSVLGLSGLYSVDRSDTWNTLNYQKLHYFKSSSYDHILHNDYYNYGDNGYNNGLGTFFNSKGTSKYLDTPVGQMEVFLDLDDDNDQYGVGTLESVGQLVGLDINQDGFLDSSDEFFDKLKLRGYNSNGEEVVLKLSDVYNALDLTKFVNTQKDVDEWEKNSTYKKDGITYLKRKVVNGTSLFRPEESYKRLDDSQKSSFKEMFKNNADENGWIDFTKTKTDEYGQKQYVFKDLANSLSLAYNKVGLNGDTRLERITFGFFDKSDKNYLADVKSRFNGMYKDYYNGEGNKLAIQREFQVITGMQFSEEKFKEFYEGLNNPTTANKYANALKDVDSVVGMKLNDNGMLTLAFDSGRTMYISLDDLFTSDGEFNLTEKGERASVMSGASSMNEEELNQLDFSQIGADTNGGIFSLAELGVEFIRKETFSNGRTAFILTTRDNKEIVASTLYKIRSVEDMVKFAELEEKDKLRAMKFEREA
ncbi:hypothetical protein LS70_001250 [Helicobacter sp. MIT 11-5569]|uniref:hypothetical protein n=1 Tax=Helicobacter sp. MIT 11-5569 TaxID=1548151 RepID=UPI00051F9894|nr:hypothetical protein [Helicobacter sp. MIT 11-5569]TLD85203.1 hypothetical protein LS70_001250 [Helicobacter sp. MIT 11-5569]